MTATDELRKLLDERGVEWWPMHDDEVGYREDRDTEFLVYGCKHVAHEWGCRLQVDMLTPEQAISATLGRERETELQKALNKAAGNWAKADAELCKALDFMRIWISEDAHLGESELSAVFEKAEGLRNLDAIESAITATLGAGTCRLPETRIDHGSIQYNGTTSWRLCSACGAEVLADPANFCPNCGRRVESCPTS